MAIVRSTALLRWLSEWPTTRSHHLATATTMSGYSPENCLLLACLRPSAGGSQPTSGVSGSLGWERFLDLCAWHRVSGQACETLRLAGGPDEMPAWVLAELERRYERAARRAVRLNDELGRVLSALFESGIEVVLLKGAALVRTVYADPAVRPMGDFDLLIREDRLDEAERVVLGLGYEFFDSPEAQTLAREKHRHYPRLTRKEGRFAVELHRHIVGVGSCLHFDVAELWRGARPATLGSARERVLGAEDQLIHLCLNFFLDRRLFYQSSSALGQLVDVARVVESYPGGVDWSQLLDSTQRRACEGPVACGLWSAKQLLAAQVPEEALAWLTKGRVTSQTGELFIRHKVLERRPWFFHELVTPLDNASANVIKSAIRRFVFHRSYLKVKYGRPAGTPGTLHLLLRHLVDLLLLFKRYLLRPAELSQNLRVDRWMHSLELPTRRSRN